MNLEHLQQLIADLKDSIMEMKSANDKRLTEIETKGAASATSIAAVEKANGKIGDLQTKISDLETETKANKTAMARLGMGADGKVETKEAKALLEYKSSFNNVMRLGPDASPEDLARVKANQVEKKSVFQVTDNALGGYSALPEYGELYRANLEELSPIRQYCKVNTIGAGVLKIPNIEGNDIEATWGDEFAAVTPEALAKTGMLEIPLHLLTVMPPITRTLREDTSYDIMGEINYFSYTKMAQKESSAFHTGNGVKRPRGFLTYGAEIETTNTGDAAALEADAFHTIEGTMKTAYRKGAAYFANRKTIAAMRLLKDANDRYLLQWDFSKGVAATLNGYPVIEDADMPDIAAGSTPIAFANFSEGYQIVDNALGNTWEEMPISHLTPELVFYYSRSRVGGAVRVKEAIKLMKIAVNA